MMKHAAYGLLLVALVSVTGIMSAAAEERRTTTTTTTPDTTTESTYTTMSPPGVTPSAGTTSDPNSAFYPLIMIFQTQFVVAPGGTATVNYMAQCSVDEADLDCSVQIYRIAEECTLHDSYTLQTLPGGAIKYLPAGHYVFLIGKGLNWAEANKLPTTKSYLVTVIESTL